MKIDIGGSGYPLALAKYLGDRAPEFCWCLWRLGVGVLKIMAEQLTIIPV